MVFKIKFSSTYNLRLMFINLETFFKLCYKIRISKSENWYTLNDYCEYLDVVGFCNCLLLKDGTSKYLAYIRKLIIAKKYNAFKVKPIIWSS